MDLWNDICKLLKRKFSSSIYSLWIEPLACVHADDEVIELSGPDRFLCSWISDHYIKDIQEALAAIGKENVRVRITVGPGTEGSMNKPLLEGKKEQLPLPAMPKPVARPAIRTLHPRYTFDEFMVGDSNAMAQTACQTLASGDTSLGQCVYIDAGTGLGKSHLTHAVAHHVINHAPATRINYLTAKQLTSELVRAIKNNVMEEFKAKYHTQCDVLLMEDVHTLAGRKGTQEELASALDVLLDTGKRVIFTGSMPPKDIPDIGNGVRSRLSSGLIATINPPDLRTRIRIIQRKAKNSALQLSEELIVFIAENIQGDIRQVESAIVGLKAKSALLKTAPDMDMVKEVIGNIVGRCQTISVEVIRDFLARQFKVSVDDMQSKSRRKAIAFPRQVSMYLARKYTDQALADIGRAFNRDHSTVVHSIRVITETMARNNSVRGQVEHLSKKMQQKFL